MSKIMNEKKLLSSRHMHVYITYAWECRQNAHMTLGPEKNAKFMKKIIQLLRHSLIEHKTIVFPWSYGDVLSTYDKCHNEDKKDEMF